MKLTILDVYGKQTVEHLLVQVHEGVLKNSKPFLINAWALLILMKEKQFEIDIRGKHIGELKERLKTRAFKLIASDEKLPQFLDELEKVGK